jgi:predicted dehydrogenase
MNLKSRTTRREFIRNSTIAAGSVLLSTPGLRAVAASDKIRVGFIGLGNRGSQLLSGFLVQPDVKVVAFCDVYEPYLMRDFSKIEKETLQSAGLKVIPKMQEKLTSDVARYKDFRRLLERTDIDAVVISTPDHWHAIQTIQACAAGKDVYVEKPLSLTIVEGRKMVQAAQRYHRIAQVGLHRRSSVGYEEIGRVVRSGKIGQVSLARCYRINNMAPNGIGKYPDADPPATLDWDMWLGPRAKRPFRFNIAPYKFRWWADYSSQMANWGIHYCDAIRWLIEQEAPLAVSAHANNIGVDDDRTIPVNMEVTFEMPRGATVVFGQYEGSGGEALASGEIELRGTLGNLYAGSNGSGYTIVPSSPGQFQEGAATIPPEEKSVAAGNQDLTNLHIRDFLDCIKSRQKTKCDLETGHRSSTFAHLANIALAVKSRITWDAQAERIMDHKAANELLSYEYRKPWTL